MIIDVTHFVFRARDDFSEISTMGKCITETYNDLKFERKSVFFLDLYYIDSVRLNSKGRPARTCTQFEFLGLSVIFRSLIIHK